MSRFDDFARSRAEGRGFFSALKRTTPGAELDTAGVSRRDLMKKAGLVTGAAVVGSTLIQSVTAPAYATSHCTDLVDRARGCGSTCPTLCANTSPCETGPDCASGVCSNNVCVAANACNTNTGSVAAQDASCTTGYCNTATQTCTAPPANVAPGSGCHGTAVCAVGSTCVSGTCKVNDGLPCSPQGSNANCASGTCSNNGSSGVCLTRNGGPCTKNGDCLSNKCAGVICAA